MLPYLQVLRSGSQYILVLCNQLLFGLIMWIFLPLPITSSWFNMKYMVSLFVSGALYDPLFFVLHCVMHKVGWSFHKVHHQSTFTPANALAAHPVDAILTAYGPILLCARFFPHSLMNYTILIVFASASTVYAHSYQDFFTESYLHGIIYKAHAHQRHHEKPTHNFGDGIMLLDRLVGTYAPIANNYNVRYSLHCYAPTRVGK